MNLTNIKSKIKKFPQNPGVYTFKDKSGKIIYIGKATSLRNRVGSYFRRYKGSERPIEMMISEVVKVDYFETDTVLEALILEANLIKKNQPKYNVKEKDDKSFSYFVITKEEFPRVLILRKTDLPVEHGAWSMEQRGKKNVSRSTIQVARLYGPYTSAKQMQIALKIIRKIFPFHSRNEKSEKGCLEFQIGLCPGPYEKAISKSDYKKNIRGIKMILEGKKKSLVRKLEKEMREYAARHDFEKAADIRNKIFALKHIQDIALVSSGNDNFEFRILNFDSNHNFQNYNLKIDSKFKIKNSKFFRIEAYDISNISGDFAVGSMIVFDNSEGEIKPNKSEYRKFKIKTVQGANDVGMMNEVLRRRFKNDWRRPDLIILDGGKGHVNMAERIILELGLSIPLVGVAKGATRKISNYQLIISNQFPITNLKFKNVLNDRNIIKNITDEAHRFAITYHRKLREDILR